MATNGNEDERIFWFRVEGSSSGCMRRVCGEFQDDQRCLFMGGGFEAVFFMALQYHIPTLPHYPTAMVGLGSYFSFGRVWA